MKLHLEPSPLTTPQDNGIGQVIRAMGKYLPPLGVDFTADPNSADVVAFHAGTALGKRVDCLHCHGLYWQDLEHTQFSRSNNVANQRIIDAARRAKIITVPSNWVAEPFRRDMRIDPVIVGHGIDVGEWEPANTSDYILWNKNRPTDVCDPTWAWKLAEKGLKVISTFGPPGKLIPNLRVTGQLPFEKMKPIIQAADLYLATAPETFGIGTLEALACGVPVLGFDWCGTSDLVKHKETGWLSPVGDVDGLIEGAAWLRAHRAEVGANARAFAASYNWPAIAEKYYQIYQQAMQPEPSGVSIVITNYNYARWVVDAIRSCLWQQQPAQEIIVVDDGSTDNSREVLTKYSDKLKLIFQPNAGVAAARNNGIAQARYPLIVCLDADDMLAPQFIQALRPAMEQDRGLGVAYAGVKYIDENSHDTGFSDTRVFNWEVQARAAIPPPTCIPSGSMFRRSMWERCGGYRQKYAPGEDAEFWTHGLSLGFTAEMVTSETLFWYRGHDGSASRSLKYVATDDNKPWAKDHQYPMAAPSYYVPAVRSYYRPLVSIIVPVGPGHEALAEDAIQSVIGQTIREWELILVDDTHEKPGRDHFPGKITKQYPFLKFIKTGGGKGAGAARNAGIGQARGKFVLFLDADDWLHPDCLARMLEAHVQTDRYIFSDFYAVDGSGAIPRRCFDYDRETYRDKQVVHSVTALVPTAWAREVGGFDPKLPGWEEYDFYMKLAVKGYCGTCLHEPLFYYRLETGTRRKISQKMEKQLNAGFAKKFGGAKMSPCCGSAGDTILDAKRALGLLPREQAANTPDLPNEVRLEFVGPQMGPVAYQVNGRVYYGAKDGLHSFINVPREDVEKLVATRKWVVIRPPDGAVTRPEPEPVQPEPAPQPPIIRRRR